MTPVRRAWAVATLAACASLLAGCRAAAPAERPRYAPPAGSLVTRLPARVRPSRTLVVEAATDIAFMRPFLRAFQARHADVAVVYVDMLSNSLLDHALRACAGRAGVPDLYVSVATDHLIRLANDGCGREVSPGVPVADWREWRGEVFAFAVEPAVLVYNRRLVPDGSVPRSHLELVEALRRRPEFWRRRVGTYDIRLSGLAFNYAELDSHEASMFGRLIESLGRSETRLFCCSNGMVAAVRRGEVAMAYNVQLSYAYAAQRRDPGLGVVVPGDFQAVQTRSAMVPAGAARPELGRELLTFLLSSAGRSIEAAALTPPGGTVGRRFDLVGRGPSEAEVSGALLRLQDAARRRALVLEWGQAVLPPRRPAASRRPAPDGS